MQTICLCDELTFAESSICAWIRPQHPRGTQSGYRQRRALRNAPGCLWCSGFACEGYSDRRRTRGRQQRRSAALRANILWGLDCQTRSLLPSGQRFGSRGDVFLCRTGARVAGEERWGPRCQTQSYPCSRLSNLLDFTAWHTQSSLSGAARISTIGRINLIIYSFV
jgi:hypothetical protein